MNNRRRRDSCRIRAGPRPLDEQMTNSAQLIEALGGGSDTTQLPSEKMVAAKKCRRQLSFARSHPADAGPLLCREPFYRADHSVACAISVHRVHSIVISRPWLKVRHPHAEDRISMGLI